MHVFKICVKGDVKWSETSLMNLVWMLFGPVVSRAVGPQRFALPNNFMIGNTLETKGSIRVMRKSINTPMRLLPINCHWGIDTLSCKSKVLIQFIRIDSYWLMAGVKYTMDRLPYFLVQLRRECVGHKPSLCFPNQFLKTITGVLEDVPRSLNVRGCVCFPTITPACLLQRSNRGGSRGRVQGVRTPPPSWDDLRFSNTTDILQKKTMWFIGVEVEQETSAPPPKKNPGSVPVECSDHSSRAQVICHPHTL